MCRLPLLPLEPKNLGSDTSCCGKYQTPDAACGNHDTQSTKKTAEANKTRNNHRNKTKKRNRNTKIYVETLSGKNHGATPQKSTISRTRLQIDPRPTFEMGSSSRPPALTALSVGTEVGAISANKPTLPLRLLHHHRLHYRRLSL